MKFNIEKIRDKGFSLVELIVVIAIMAVLVGILAPAYLKYVEKSRKSADTQAVSQILGAGEATATDEEYRVPANAVFQVTANNGEIYLSVPEETWAGAENAGSEEAENRSEAETEWKDTSNDGNPYRLKAKAFKSDNGIIKGVFETSGALRWYIDSSDVVFGKMCEYSKSLDDKFREPSSFNVNN